MPKRYTFYLARLLVIAFLAQASCVEPGKKKRRPEYKNMPSIELMMLEANALAAQREKERPPIRETHYNKISPNIRSTVPVPPPTKRVLPSLIND
jgi:hypothetical protein